MTMSLSIHQDQKASRIAAQSKRGLAAFRLFATAMILVTSAAAAPAGAKSRDGLVNRPAAQPFACVIDEGYGRWTSCDQSGS
jgi:hypothetical protein